MDVEVILPRELQDNPDADELPPLLALKPKDEVAKTLGALYMQTLYEAQVDFLKQRTPKDKIKMRKGKGKDEDGNPLMFPYVEHGYVTERLNMVFGFNWDFEVVSKDVLEDEVVVEGRLTVRTPSGKDIVKTQFGGQDIERWTYGAKQGRPLSIADACKSAASDALKKCASLLGIGLDLYGKDRLAEIQHDYVPAQAPESRAYETSPVPRPERPKQVSSANATSGATPAQVNLLTKLAMDSGMGVQRALHEMGIGAFTELSRAGASQQIDWLKGEVEAVRSERNNTDVSM